MCADKSLYCPAHGSHGSSGSGEDVSIETDRDSDRQASVLISLY